jgi:hypothetical protein
MRRGLKIPPSHARLHTHPDLARSRAQNPIGSRQPCAQRKMCMHKPTGTRCNPRAPEGSNNKEELLPGTAVAQGRLDSLIALLANFCVSCGGALPLLVAHSPTGLTILLFFPCQHEKRYLYAPCTAGELPSRWRSVSRTTRTWSKRRGQPSLSRPFRRQQSTSCERRGTGAARVGVTEAGTLPTHTPLM